MSRITVAQRVRQLREMRGIKLEQLARLTEVEPSTLSRYESGDIRNPSVTILQKICNAVDITLPEFFLGLEEPTQHSPDNENRLLGFDEAVLMRRAAQYPPHLKMMLLKYMDYLEYLKQKGE